MVLCYNCEQLPATSIYDAIPLCEKCLGKYKRFEKIGEGFI